MSEKKFSKCGMRCDLCLVYRPNVEKEDRREEMCRVWKKIWPGFETDSKSIYCDGCFCEAEDAVLFSPGCETRSCVMKQGLEHCGYCEKYPCENFPAEPSREELVQKIDVEHQWTWEEEKLMEAYRCKEYMDEFRKDKEKKKIAFSRLTACGECCDGCRKKVEGICRGCIETDGYVPEWSGSGRCKIHSCARTHGVQFCGICRAFPCNELTTMIHWNPNIVEYLNNLAKQYQSEGEDNV